MHGMREVFPPPEGIARPANLEPPDVEEEELRLSHAQRANHHRRDVENRDSLRIYAPEEQERLSAECRGFLLYLEQLGIEYPTVRKSSTSN